MTDLSLLKVSLTKHNAHKLAMLLKRYEVDQLLDKLPEVHAEEAQARRNLSISADGSIPEVWAKAKALGDEAVDAMVLAGIIFSHHQLINAMADASSRSAFSGRIERNKQLGGKAYTNFARIIDQLGFATQLDYAGITFDLAPMFDIVGLGPLVGELLELKLATARWGRTGTVAQEAAALGFHKVFGTNAEQFEAWLSGHGSPAATASFLMGKDREFFQAEGEDIAARPFEFRPGHVERAVEPISRTASPRTRANQLHNDIQNRLYVYLCETLGGSNVGTEVDTGLGTAVDVVAKEAGTVTFYEIKTGSSVRSSIRQAIPQLLEYAFWPDAARAEHLVIVSHLPMTNSAEQYLEHLRRQFNLPIFYRQFSLESNKLL